MAKRKTEVNASPKGGKRGCLCADGTYSSECCDGTLQAQGIGATESQSSVVLNNTNNERVITASRG